MSGYGKRWYNTCGPAVHLGVAPRQTGAAGVPAAPVWLRRELVDDDACGRGVGGQRERGGA
jgi:hypothetical protein